MSEVRMPRLSDTMEEGVISRWVKQEGEAVAKGDVLAEIDTDKTTMDLEAYEEGILEQHLAAEGETVAIGEPIAVIGDGSGAKQTDAGAGKAAGESDKGQEAPAEAAGTQEGAEKAGPEKAEAEEAGEGRPEKPEPEAPAAEEPAEEPARETGAPVLRSPLARRIAREHHLDLSAVKGTGPGGRVVRADVEDAIAAQEQQSAPAGHAAAHEAPPAGPVAAPPAARAGEEDTEVALNANQRITAQRLSATTSIPTFELTVAVGMDALLAFRRDTNERLAPTGTKISVTDLLVRAVAVVLRLHPEVNASWGGDRIIRHGRVHVGIAVALEDGLIVPVVRDADTKSVSRISAEAADLAARARSGKLKPDEFKGGTFSISNLGMFGIEAFTAILNPPEAAILAVGATTEEPVIAEGALSTRRVMRMSLTVDHRVLNGASGANFLRELKAVLEEPLRIVI